MIENFEKHTQPLTELEQALANAVLNELFQVPIKAPEIAERINKTNQLIKPITEVTVRKILSRLRQTGLHGICSSSDGFWLSHYPTEILSQIRSLEQRIEAIQATRDGLDKFYGSLLFMYHKLDEEAKDDIIS
jgi:hypothetical protein